MKSIYKILLLTMLFYTAAISQEGVLGIVKPSGTDQCDGTINLEFVEKLKKYQFDDNNISAYIKYVGYGEKLGTPWNFIETSSFDILKAKVSKSSGFYAVNKIESNNSKLNINPSTLSKNKEDITFSFNGSGKQIIEISGCHETDPELLLFTAPSKSFGIEFFKVCDTDDDIQVKPVGTMVTSPYEICIDGVKDLTIDEMYKENSSGTLLIKAKGDELVKDTTTNKYYVIAGSNLKCDVAANPPGPDECPNSFNITGSMKVVNSTFGKIGISAINKGTYPLRFNYDLIDDDGKLDDDEYFVLKDYRESTGELKDGFHEVYLVKELPAASSTSIKHGVSYLNSNTSAINTKTAPDETLTHEIGHGKWGFGHPRDKPSDKGFTT